ncbi:MAG: 2-isopropylmalate synthase [Planctomycetota bacterium]|jgi:isopropylmalate/homocitrate/citramalate synthase
MTTKQEQSAAESRMIRIFDTTLRDGEQSPGASLNTSEKLEIARQLELLNVDIIEAGFPISSPDDFDAVRSIADIIENCTVAGLARCMEKDIKRAADAVKDAKQPRIHVFCATSAIHRQYKLKRAEEEIIKLSVEGVELAKSFVDDVEFSPEDAARTEPPFLTEVVEATIEAGATTVNIPDTVGYSTPDHFKQIIEHLYATVKNIDRAVISVHCHNDLGLAVANSLAAVQAGARQVECTINGLGERAGNASLEEVVMAIKTRADVFNCRTRDQDKLDVVFEQFKHLADRKKEVFDEDLESIVGQVLEESENAKSWELVSLQTTGGTGVLPTATVRLKNLNDETEVTDAATGDGPIDAAFTCIMRLTDMDVELKEYDLRAVTGGRDAQGEVHLELRYLDRTYRGRGRSTDIIEASVFAYIHALNRAILGRKKAASELREEDE